MSSSSSGDKPSRSAIGAAVSFALMGVVLVGLLAWLRVRDAEAAA